jgi:hypothetical protein
VNHEERPGRIARVASDDSNFARRKFPVTGKLLCEDFQSLEFIAGTISNLWKTSNSASGVRRKLNHLGFIRRPQCGGCRHLPRILDDAIPRQPCGFDRRTSQSALRIQTPVHQDNKAPAIRSD